MIRAIIGLGNPGPRFYKTRHNIGFQVVDELARQLGATFEQNGHAEVAQAVIPGAPKPLWLIKPQTFMNSSGLVIPLLKKKGISIEEIVVVHDELELPFGSLKIRQGGSAKGHNGLRSIIAHGGDTFWRLRWGIGRPSSKEDVPTYVLESFSEPESAVQQAVSHAVDQLVQLVSNQT